MRLKAKTRLTETPVTTNRPTSGVEREGRSAKDNAPQVHCERISSYNRSINIYPATDSGLLRSCKPRSSILVYEPNRRTTMRANPLPAFQWGD